MYATPGQQPQQHHPVSPWVNIFSNAATTVDPRPFRLVRLVGALAGEEDTQPTLRAYAGAEWPTASIPGPDGLITYKVGFNPQSGEPATGVVRRVLAPNLFAVTFGTAAEIFVHADEIVDDERAQATIAAPAVRLREGIVPAFGLGPDPAAGPIVGVLRYDNRQKASPVMDDGSVALVIPEEGHHLRVFLEELEPMPPEMSPQQQHPGTDDEPAHLLQPFNAGEAVMFRHNARRIYGDVSAITDFDRPAVVVGTRRGGVLVLCFPDKGLRVGVGAMCLERAWRPPVGARVRVCVERPASQPTRPNCLWAHAPEAEGMVVAVTHDGLCFVEFEDASPPVQLYYLSEIAPAATRPAGNASEQQLADKGHRCPLTLAPFCEPVVAADGQSYESSAWQELCDTYAGDAWLPSPMTRQMISAVAYPNRTLRALIDMLEARVTDTEEDAVEM